MKLGLKTQIQVGVFVTLGFITLTVGIIVLGGGKSLFRSYTPYHTHFEAVDGLINGAKVLLGGIRVGSVNGVAFDEEQRSIRIDFTVQEDYSKWIRADSKISIATQGVLGDKYLSINMGTLDQSLIPEGGKIQTEKTGGLTSFFEDSEPLLQSLTKIAKSLENILGRLESNKRSDRLFEGLAKTSKNLGVITDQLKADLNDGKLGKAMGHLEGILRKVDEGEGSVGALINDPALYNDIKLLVGGVNRNRIVRNLVRQTIKEREEEAEEVRKEEEAKLRGKAPASNP
jgi:phospholipid/cholesterol/gamma-HCH transport system substrate-binding protein